VLLRASSAQKVADAMTWAVACHEQRDVNSVLFLQAQLWFNLDGSFSPVYLAILPMAASKDTNKG
jgi:hypothetical protein